MDVDGQLMFAAAGNVDDRSELTSGTTSIGGSVPVKRTADDVRSSPDGLCGFAAGGGCSDNTG